MFFTRVGAIVLLIGLSCWGGCSSGQDRELAEARREIARLRHELAQPRQDRAAHDDVSHDDVGDKTPLELGAEQGRRAERRTVVVSLDDTQPDTGDVPSEDLLFGLSNASVSWWSSRGYLIGGSRQRFTIFWVTNPVVPPHGVKLAPQPVPFALISKIEWIGHERHGEERFSKARLTLSDDYHDYFDDRRHLEGDVFVWGPTGRDGFTPLNAGSVVISGKGRVDGTIHDIEIEGGFDVLQFCHSPRGLAFLQGTLGISVYEGHVSFLRNNDDIKDTWLKTLMPNTAAVSKLTLGRCPQITRAGWNVLEELDGLEELTLMGTMMTEARVDSLCDMKQLKTLTLSNMRLPPGAVERIRRALPNCRVISRGIVVDDSLGDEPPEPDVDPGADVERSGSQVLQYPEDEMQSESPDRARRPRRRVWTSEDGYHTLLGSLISVVGDTVRIRRVDGKEIEVARDRLSEECQQYLRDLSTNR